jgi:PAS domain S-box-containing protein
MQNRQLEGMMCGGVHSKDGTILYGLFSGVIISSQGQRFYLTVMIDQTERKRAETQLLESESKFKSFAEQTIAAIYLIQDGVFKYVNPTFARMFGYSAEEFLNDLPFEKLVYAEDIPLVKERVAQRITGAATQVHYTFRGLKQNGEVFHVEIYGSAVSYQEDRRLSEPS